MGSLWRVTGSGGQHYLTHQLLGCLAVEEKLMHFHTVDEKIKIKIKIKKYR